MNDAGESFWSAGWTDELDTRLGKGIPEAAKELDHFVYLYNTYEACIQSPQTSCRRGLANPFPSSSPKASKERSFESPFVNMGFSGKEDDAAAVFATLIKDLTRERRFHERGSFNRIYLA